MFNSIDSLLKRFAQLQAVKVFCKPLAENDNSKQQIYMGGSLNVVQMFSHADVESDDTGTRDNYKIKLNFFWIDDDSYEQATGAQLILYPDYPEVRLSGFLRGCRFAPNELMRPVPKNLRRFNNAADGRILFFGVTADGRTLAYAAARSSMIANEFQTKQARDSLHRENLFYVLPIEGSKTSRTLLLDALTAVWRAGSHTSSRLNSKGQAIAYKAKNGGGYTLEALLNIIPNGRTEPDFMGWEIKSFSKSAITLMTPEPNGGFYAEQRVEAFVRRFGHPTHDDTIYFTGMHRAGLRSPITGLTLNLRGFNASTNIITDVNGAVELLTDSGACAASWSFAKLMVSWNKKHAQAAYVRYIASKNDSPEYRYLSPVGLGEGTSFTHYLQALQAGKVVYDPASKVSRASTPDSTVKARSQFRIAQTQLPMLYQQFEQVDLNR